MPPAAPAIFLDRDDTLIATRAVAPDGDLGDPALVRLMPSADQVCWALKTAGYRLVVVSNQGGVARGKFGVGDVERVNARLNELLGGVIDAFRFCPYHPDGTVPEFTREHPWRKPAPGMILDAAAALSIDLARSWLVGDSDRDMRAGRSAGCRTVQVVASEPPLPPEALANPMLELLSKARVRVASAGRESRAADFIAVGLDDAMRIILREGGNPS